jgi:hypothetical protein
MGRIRDAPLHVTLAVNGWRKTSFRTRVPLLTGSGKLCELRTFPSAQFWLALCA